MRLVACACACACVCRLQLDPNALEERARLTNSTPLHLACINCPLECVEMLLSANASVTAINYVRCCCLWPRVPPPHTPCAQCVCAAALSQEGSAVHAWLLCPKRALPCMPFRSAGRRHQTRPALRRVSLRAECARARALSARRNCNLLCTWLRRVAARRSLCHWCARRPAAALHSGTTHVGRGLYALACSHSETGPLGGCGHCADTTGLRAQSCNTGPSAVERASESCNTITSMPQTHCIVISNQDFYLNS